MRFRDLPIWHSGSIFVFESDDNPDFLDIAKGPWIKLSPKQYGKLSLNPQRITVGSINTPVRQLSMKELGERFQPALRNAATGSVTSLPGIPIVEMPFFYKTHQSTIEAAGIVGVCGLQIYRYRDNSRQIPCIVVFSELADNPGMSVTNTIEGLATFIRSDFNLPIFQTVWIEHYPKYAGKREEYSRVNLTWNASFTPVLAKEERERGRYQAPGWQYLDAAVAEAFKRGEAALSPEDAQRLFDQ